MTDTATGERLERMQAAVARSLDLLDAGLVDEARGELQGALGAARHAEPEAIRDPLSEQEFERAFDAAEPEVEQMLDADRVAEAALRQAGADELHVEGEGADVTVALAEEPAELPEGFATATMAELLERQGDTDGASRIRAALSPEAAAASPGEASDRPKRREVMRTLERWLENVREARA